MIHFLNTANDSDSSDDNETEESQSRISSRKAKNNKGFRYKPPDSWQNSQTIARSRRGHARTGSWIGMLGTGKVKDIVRMKDNAIDEKTEQ